MTTIEGPTGTVLGARVTLPDGLTGEVWSLAPRARGDARERVWVAIGTDPPHGVCVPVEELQPEHQQADLFTTEETA